MVKITKDMIIADILDTEFADQAVPVLQEMGMHCLGCVKASDETLEEACLAHDVDVNDIVAKLKVIFGQQ